MKTKTLTLVVLLTALMLTPLAMAAPGDGPRGPRGERDGTGERFHRGPGAEAGFDRGMGGPMQGDFGRFLLGRMGEKLELTDDQKAAIKTILEDAREPMQAAQTAVREAIKALQEATQNGTESDIIAAGKAVGDTMTRQALLRASTMDAVKLQLTEEQRQQLEVMKAEMQDKMRQRFQDRDEADKPDRQGRDEGRPRKGRRGGPDQDDEAL